MLRSRSADITDLARQHIPGGVNSTIRAIEPPMVITRASGAILYDADGQRTIDYHAAFGPVVLGHCHPAVTRAVAETAATLDLIGIGATEPEARLAEAVCRHVPSAERVAFCNSGTEATLSAIRLARGVTGRQKLIKFQGCYHGHHDAVLMNVATPAERFGERDVLSAGLSQAVVENTIVLPYNDLDAVEAAVAAEGDAIAAIIVEPIAHNVGCILPAPGFLEGLREITRRRGIVLIFDEVITGFRHALGGYQAICGVTPDLTTLAKAMANGYPIAAVAGRADLLDHYTTAGGDVYFAGTYNGHPVSAAAALATIAALADGSAHARMAALGEGLRQGLADIIARVGLRATVAGYASIWVVYFMDGPIETYADLLRNDTARFIEFRRETTRRGAFQLPLNLKRNHISAAHTEAHIAETLQIAEDVLREMAR
ncbi:MAG: glutamate-1-semialdehyde 2,1-aminomutase [Anaerolineae bacterium]